MRSIPIAALAALIVSAPAAAQSWKGEVELGVLKTTGNTNDTNLNGRLGLKREEERWRHTADLRSVYSRSEGRTTAGKFLAALQTDYKITERHFWFLRGAYDNDRFSGYDFQSSLTAGYGNRVWESGERSFLDLTAGAGYRFNRLETADESGDLNEDEAILRLAGQFDYALSETALFRQKLGVEVGLERNNTITQSETSVQSAILANLSMKAAYRVKHVSDAPADATSLDTEMSLSLLYGF